MGLLDFMNSDDPQTQGLLGAAMGLLNASGPSRTPISMGQAIGQGMMGYQQGRKGALDQQREQMQMDMLKQQISAATRKNNLINDWIGNIGSQAQNAVGTALTGNGTRTLSDGGVVPNTGPTNEGAAKLEQLRKTNPLMNGVPVDAIRSDLMFNDGKEIGKWMFQRGVPDMQVSNGYAFDKNRLAPGFLPQLNTSQNGQTSMVEIGPDGRPRISSPEGALGTYSAYQDAEARAKAGMQPLPLDYASPDGRPLGGSIGGYLGGQRQPSVPGAQGLDVTRLTPAQATFLQNQDPEAYARGVSRFGATAAGGAPVLQSAAEKEAQVGGVKVKNSVDEALAKAYPDTVKQNVNSLAKASSAIELIDKALKHPGLSTATGLQGSVDPRNYIAGTDAKDFQVIMDQLGGQAFLQAFDSLKGGGQITEVEGAKATNAMARLNRSQSTEEFKKSLNDLRDVYQSGIGRLKATSDPVGIARDRLSGANEAPQPQAQKTLAEYGYKNDQQAIQDARNAMLRNPSAKAEIIRRLEAAGITNHGFR